jgi:predicted transcriptional regulator
MAEANKLAILSARTGKSVEVLVREALVNNNNIVTQAARELGISRQALSTYLNRKRREGHELTPVRGAWYVARSG